MNRYTWMWGHWNNSFKPSVLMFNSIPICLVTLLSFFVITHNIHYHLRRHPLGKKLRKPPDVAYIIVSFHPLIHQYMSNVIKAEKCHWHDAINQHIGCNLIFNFLSRLFFNFTFLKKVRKSICWSESFSSFMLHFLCKAWENKFYVFILTISTKHTIF